MNKLVVLTIHGYDDKRAILLGAIPILGQQYVLATTEIDYVVEDLSRTAGHVESRQISREEWEVLSLARRGLHAPAADDTTA